MSLKHGLVTCLDKKKTNSDKFDSFIRTLKTWT